MEAQERFAAPVERMVATSEGTYGSDDGLGARRAFGSTALKTAGQTFPMLVNARLVVMMPAKRVDGLIERGEGDRSDPGHGRLHKARPAVPSRAPHDWLALASQSEASFTRRKPTA